MTRTPLNIEQGATLRISFFLQNDDGTAIDLTGYTARMKIRTYYGGPIVLTATVTIPNPTGGEVLVYASPVDTAALTFTSGYWDLEIEDMSGEVYRPVGGPCYLDQEASS